MQRAARYLFLSSLAIMHPLHADEAPPAGAVEVRMVTQPTLSPDGATIVFEWREDLWSVSSQGGRATRLTQHPAYDGTPRFAPDGKTLYFISNRAGANQLFSMPASGGTAVQHTFHSEGATLQDISPDGRTALLLAMRDHDQTNAQRLLEVDLQKDAPERLCFDAPAAMASYSSDGKSILFCCDGENMYRKGYRGSKAASIWRFDRDSKNFAALVKNDAEQRWPLAMKNGDGFYYVSENDGTLNLHARSFAGDKDESLTQFKDDGVMYPTRAKGGDTLVFRRGFDLWRYQPGSQPQQLKIWTAGDFPDMTKEAHRINGTNDAAFSKSGLEIAFAADGELFAMDTVLREPNRLTETPAYESDVQFSKDGLWLYFREDDGVNANYWRMKCKKKGAYWWKAKEFDKEAVTRGTQVKEQLALAPDNKHIAYVSDYGNLCVALPDGTQERVLHKSNMVTGFDWSPDSKWLVYAATDENYNSDIFIVPIDGSREAYDVSRHPDNEASPCWSPDGRMIAFTGKRLGNKVGLYQVHLRLEDEIRSSHDRKEKEAVAAMRDDPLYRTQNAPQASNDPAKATPKLTPEPVNPDAPKSEVPKYDAPKSETPKSDASAAEPAPQPQPQPQPQPPAASEPAAKADAPPAEAQANNKPAAKTEEVKKSEPLQIDFDELSERIHKLDTNSLEPGSLLWSADSKGIFFQSADSKNKTLFRVDVREGASAAPVVQNRGRLLNHDTRDNLYWVVDNAPAVLAKGKLTTYPIDTRIMADRTAQQRLYFRMIWRLLRDRYYDGQLNGRDWNAVLAKYENMAAESNSSIDFDRIVMMLMGELNGSHLSFKSNPWPRPWSDESAEFRTTRHTGLRFDHGNGSGPLKVASVIANSPAAHAQPAIQPGESVVAVDGRPVDAGTPETNYLNGRPTTPLMFTLLGADGKTRDVELQPINWAKARALAGDAAIAERRKEVEKASNGKLGYIHVARMHWDEFEEFERQLFAAGHGKEGLIIDVRDNGGGFTADHLLTALCQPKHAITAGRDGSQGYPQDRMVYASWNKPIAVLCNQNSFSNAEVFSHAIKTLKRGLLVGMPTAGGVISTGQFPVLNAGTLGLPFRGWFLPGDGEDMELNGAKPDSIVPLTPADADANRDPQLAKAIEMLGKNVAEQAKQSKPFVPRYRFHATGGK